MEQESKRQRNDIENLNSLCMTNLARVHERMNAARPAVHQSGRSLLQRWRGGTWSPWSILSEHTAH